jgi:glucose 1-dehydrogenase
MRLANKVALVTGSTQGIGRAIAVRLAREGADIIVAGHLDNDDARESAELVRAEGRRVYTSIGDIGEVEVCRRLIREGVEELGQIDILVNNAGVEQYASFWDVSEEHYDRTLDVNLKGPFFTTQAFVQYRREQQPAGSPCGGKVINTSSVHEELPFPHFTSYCASKGGMKMMMRNLSVELAPLGITVNNIAPGAIKTPMNAKLLNSPDQLKALLANIPLKRLGTPEDVAGVAAFLASADADYITGATFYVDGGLLWNYTEQ